MGERKIGRAALGRNADWNRLVDEAGAGFRERDGELAALIDREDGNGLTEYINKVRGRIKELFPLDFESCALEPETASVVHMDGYAVENVSIQSMPGYYVPINVYVPEGKKGPYPAVLVPMGHYPEGKCFENNRIMCAGFAKKGIMAATFDPICQGERDLFPERQADNLGNDMWAVMEHMVPGTQAYMLGENLQSYFIWDGMRVLDYICSRGDADVSRIGCTGQSGGGTQTQFLAALDDRITVASPIHSTTQQMLNLRERGIGDVEQSPFGRDRGFSLDYADYVIAAFPKKIMLNVGLRDMFDIRGVRRAESELSEIYRILGHDGDFAVYEDDCEHVITKRVRQNAYRWFTKWFLGAEDDAEEETELPEKTKLRCLTKRSKTPVDILAERAASRRESEPAGKEDVARFMDVRAERYSFRLPEDGKPQRVILDCGAFGEAYGLVYPGGGERLRIVADFAGLGLAKDRAPGESVLELRPFGFETAVSKGSFGYDDETNMAYVPFVRGDTLARRRVGQILTALDFAEKELGPCGKTVLDVSGQGGVLALLAVICGGRADEIRASAMPASYAQYFGRRDYLIEESAVIPGLLRLADIPRLASLAGVPVTIKDAVGPLREKLDAADVRKLYAGAKNVAVT